ncbi:unnamed protein product [Ectocarpus sp. CCAP 1310/34]|nr:unnamed protein product [Ectocarpus sp. CCAP 1310/34]
MTRLMLASLLLLLHHFTPATGFTTTGSCRCNLRMSSGSPRTPTEQQGGVPESRQKFLSGLFGGVTALALPLAALADPPLEKFKKDEVCLQRGLNGACVKFGVDDTMEEVASISTKAPAQEEPESELMATLKRRTIENKAKNDEEIATKTFANGQSGEFGPFSRYVPVKHKDTGKFELVLISELEEMKRNGLIVSERLGDVFVDPK